EALSIRSRLAKKDPRVSEPDLAVTQNNLGGVYILMKKFSQSEKMLLAAEEINENWMKFYPSLYKEKWINSIGTLFELYETWMDTITNEAAKVPYFQKIVSFSAKIHEIDSSSVVTSGYANGYGSLSWSLLFAKKFKDAEDAARKGLAIDSRRVWIKAKLAHALLLQGKYDEAKLIYEYLKPLKRSDKQTYTDICLKDLEKLERNGIINKDVDRIKLFLANQKE
ncbi:MAG TPA: hypothetical protein VI564_05770, partial [Candidatus Nanoarchaeia archaeon]|nr:hypothetical protein [Candidatus Nanoarchaeia archaeon]